MVVQKPENVLRRAEELIAVGKDQTALQSLHEIIISKRSKSASLQSLEPIMLRFVELCVNLRKGKMAKEGLYQFKNIAQNTNVSSIELVFKRFIELAEAKVTEAQAQAEQQLLDAIDDLEASETPESVMLSTVSSEQSKDRTDRAVVTPWLKFLWESYRTVLEILRNNARLEQMYQTTAHQAFNFCRVYTRKTEFRRLCDLLRNHLQNVAKYSNQPHSINLNDPDTLQRHLDTRFNQLNVASDLELWQEAFRAVEDIHSLLSMSKRPPKNVMMINYYKRLTRIFLVSDNYLFVAAAWNRYYKLARSQAALSEADQTKIASFVLLSALAIPVINSTRSKSGLLEVDDAKQKQTRLSVLLSMGKAPSRASLLKEASSKPILALAKPEIRELYNILEVEFHPLSICKKIEPVIAAIAQDPEMSAYVKPLHQVILTRLFQQLSQVYESLHLDFVMKLADFSPPFEMNRSDIEKFVMSACKKGELSIRLDHGSQLLTFESDVFLTSRAVSEVSIRLQSTPSDLVRTQLSRLSKSLHRTLTLVDSGFVHDEQVRRNQARHRALAGIEKEHQETLARRAIIERRRELVELLAMRNEREQTSKRQQKQQMDAEAEQRRQAEELRKKEIARIQNEKENINLEERKKLAEELIAKGLKQEMEDLLKLDMDSLRRLQVDLLDKERMELQNKLFFTGKRIDHFERALRRKEVSYLDQDYESQLAKESRLYEHHRQQKISLAAARHKESLGLKHRLQRILPDYQSYRGVITEKQSEEFQMRQHEAHTALESEKAKRQAAYDRYIEEERRRREEEEREVAREAERRQREEEEERKKEEAERKEAEEKARVLEEERLAKQHERDEQRRKQDEMAEKQRQREREAEEKIAKRKQQALTGSSPSPGVTASTNAWRPRQRQGDQLDADSAGRPPPRWANSNTTERSPSHDRIARADGSPRAGSPAQANTPPAPGRYVPPGKRSAQ